MDIFQGLWFFNRRPWTTKTKFLCSFSVPSVSPWEFSPLNQKSRQKRHYPHQTHHQSADCACRQWKPKRLFAIAYHKGNETEDCGQYSQQNWYYLDTERLDKRFFWVGAAAEVLTVLIHNINGSIDGDAAQQYQRRKSALVKIQSKQEKRQKQSDVWNRNHRNYHQRQPQRIEQYWRLSSWPHE